MSKKTTYTKITAKIIFVTLIFTLISAFSYGQYMKEKSISNLAHVDAKKTSMLIFEALYSAMQRGWTKKDIYEIINRLNGVDSQMKIDIYRSETVAKLFGDIEKDKKVREGNTRIANAMKGQEMLEITNSNYIMYNYPVVAKNECLRCHTNANSGDVLGVIDVSYPIENLKVSLNDMINFFIIFFVIFSLIIFIAIFVELKKYLIKPIQNFSNAIKSITTSNDISKRVEVNDNIEEIDSIKDTFNLMLNSIEYQFYHDGLTGLKNRRRLAERLEKHLNSYLMIINIDSFQEINDLYGEYVGDIILKEFGLFLKDVTPQNGFLYRLHSDEFAYLNQDAKMNPEDFQVQANTLLEQLSQRSFDIDSKGEVSLSATIGISFGSDALLTNADIALTLAKKYRKHFLVYESSMAMEKEYEKNLEWTKRLKRAIEEDRIEPLYQAIVNVDTQEVVKYESLMRMVDNDGKYISPFYFLELAKKNKLYHKLTKIMIEKTFERFKDLPYFFSVNISVEDILSLDVNKFIMKKLQESNIGHKIVFEIIESEGIENFDEVLEFINEVKSYGAKISIDDFGTGYSNFDYLMKLKVDYIKIDGSMIKNIHHDANSQMITQTVVEFAKKMNIKTVAEFVYSKNVFEKVKELKVDFAQGYYFGEPGPIPE